MGTYIFLQRMTFNYQIAFGELFGRYRDKEAVVIDTRFSGGGKQMPTSPWLKSRVSK